MKNKSENKEKKPLFRIKARPVIVGAFLCLVCAAAYVDFRLEKSPALAGGDTIYTSVDTDAGTKILGEATLVDSNVQTDGAEEPIAEASSYDTYFTAMQADRRRMRSEALETLQTVVDSSDSMPDVKEKAYNEMMTIADNITVESNIRSMVMAKGFEDCLAVINGEDLSVIVKTSGLLTNEVAQIKEIAMNESGFAPENIRIVEKNG